MLTANYRHGKFSSFQRQLNMYGFRKVVDCSDRTYAHPFFRRDCPDLLKKVRRVVSGSGNGNAANSSGTSTSNPKRRPGAAAVPAPVASTAGAAALPAPVTPRGREGEDSCSHTTGESDNGDLEDSKPPARKKTKVCKQRKAMPSSLATASDGVFPRPLQYWGDDAGVLRNAEPVRQAKRNSVVFSPKMGMQARQRQASLPPPLSPPRMAMNAGGSSDHYFSAPWHHHTGLWGGMTNSCDDRWTTGSSSCASGSSSIESPKVLPLNAADIECRDGIPVLHLPPAPTTSVPPAVSYSQSGVGATGAAFEYEGGMIDAANNGTRRFLYGAWSSSTRGVGEGEGRSGVARANHSAAAKGAVGEVEDDGHLSLNKALGFGAAIARYPSFDLSLTPGVCADATEVTAASSKGNDPVLISPAVTSDVAVSSSSSSPRGVSSNASIRWDLSRFGGPGWGSPGTFDSPATAPWAALPEFKGFMDQSGATCLTSTGGRTGGNSSLDSSNIPASSSGRGHGREVLAQEQPQHRRTLSTMPASFPTVRDGVMDPLDWALFDDNDDDEASSFAGLSSPASFHGAGEAPSTEADVVSRALPSLSSGGILAPSSPSLATDFLGASTLVAGAEGPAAIASGRRSTLTNEEAWTFGMMEAPSAMLA